jgi:hypothetical protein
MRTIVSAEQLRILLNDTRRTMGEQPWIEAMDDDSHPVRIPHGKLEALHRLERDEWVFIPVARTKDGAKLVEHGFEIHRREGGWEVITAMLESQGDKPAKIHGEEVVDCAVQSELEKLRLDLRRTALMA